MSPDLPGSLSHPEQTVALVHLEIWIHAVSIVTDTEFTLISANDSLDPNYRRLGVFHGVAYGLGHDRSQFSSLPWTRGFDLVDIDDKRGSARRCVGCQSVGVFEKTRSIVGSQIRDGVTHFLYKFTDRFPD